MTEKRTQPASASPALKLIPWIAVVLLAAFYFFTINPWVNFGSASIVSRVGGWDWRPVYTAPLFYLITLPISWMPQSIQPFALNILSVILGVFTLSLLARSVMLLPQDRTREQRSRQHSEFALLSIRESWAPPVLAVLLLGLQLTFWEHATVASGDMLNLFIFAYVIRCLLEYRVTLKETWLVKFAIVYGAGITNSYALIAYFPFFLIALVWIRGVSFFNWGFVLRMTLFGLLGLSFYLLLPIIATAASNAEMSFWEALRQNWRLQKQFLWDAKALRSRALWVSLTSLVPIFMIGIRWPSNFGDVSPAGAAITNGTFRLIHLAFFALGLWVFFDPPFSGRHLGYGLPFLTFYYLTAVAVGYFAGYILLVFRRPLSGRGWEPRSEIMKALNPVFRVATLIIVIAVPAVLAYKNFPRISITNGPYLKDYVSRLTENLPQKNGIVLSDEPAVLTLVQAADIKKNGKPTLLPLHSASLRAPLYHQMLKREFPEYSAFFLSGTNTTGEVDQGSLVRMLYGLSLSNQIYYLHPSFGYYFETFYAEPAGLTYRLKVYPEKMLTIPPLTPELLAKNEQFWTEVAPKAEDLSRRVMALKLQDSERMEAHTIINHYSRGLNDWGTRLQKADRIKEAAVRFTQAVNINSNNVVAAVNSQFNANLQKNIPTPISPDESIEKRIGEFRTIQAALSQNGPFDEPAFNQDIGVVFARGNNLRQAAQMFLRVLDLIPTNYPAQVALARTYIDLGMQEDALKMLTKIRNDHKSLSTTNQFQILYTEAMAHANKGDTNKAVQLLLSHERQNPNDPNLQMILSEFYFAIGQYDNSQSRLEKVLQVAPNNAWALFRLGGLHMNFGRFTNAIPSFDKVLEGDPSNQAALLNRAISYLQIGDLDKSQRDYEMLESLMEEPSYKVHFGLAEIAYRRKENQEAVRQYELYLKHLPPEVSSENQERKLVEQRLAELKK